MNVLRTIENIRKDVLNFEDMFIESDMPDCFSRIYESENRQYQLGSYMKLLVLHRDSADGLIQTRTCLSRAKIITSVHRVRL